MKTLKSVLGMLVALCLMLCLAVPAFATNDPADTTTASTTEASTGASSDSTEAPTGDPAETPTGDAGEAEKAPEGENSEDAPPADGEGTTGEAGEGTSTEDNHDGHVHTTPKDENKVLRTILLILEVIASIALIVVVLLQSGKESGLGNTISGNSESYMNKNKKGGLDKALASATKWVALAWILITLALGFI